MVVVTEEKSIVVFDSNFNEVKVISDAHSSPLYTQQYLNENLLATGDDDGTIKIWDLRTFQSVFDIIDEQEGSTTSIKFHSSKTYMVASNSCGNLAVYDLRKSNESKDKLYAMSDPMEEELNCIEFCKVI